MINTTKRMSCSYLVRCPALASLERIKDAYVISAWLVPLLGDIAAKRLPISRVLAVGSFNVVSFRGVE